jgi:predicted transcriptional regulator
MDQRRVALTVSVPPALARKFERLAKVTSKNKSQLFREMFRTYERQMLQEEFYALQRYGTRQARKKGVYTEEEVEALVFQDR